MVLAFLVLLSSAPSNASPVDARFGAELGLFKQEPGDPMMLTQTLDVDLTLVDAIALVAVLPLMQEVYRSDPGLLFGNPIVLTYYQGRTARFTYRVGGGIGIPAASQGPGDVLSDTSNRHVASFMNGELTPWLWATEELPIVAPSLRFTAAFGTLSIDAAADLVILVPIEQLQVPLASNGRKVGFMVPLSVSALLNGRVISGGVRLGASIDERPESSDGITVSLAPRILIRPLEILELEARMNLNLDAPRSFTDDGDAVWGLFFGVHLHL